MDRAVPPAGVDLELVERVWSGGDDPTQPNFPPHFLNNREEIVRSRQQRTEKLRFPHDDILQMNSQPILLFGSLTPLVGLRSCALRLKGIIIHARYN